MAGATGSGRAALRGCGRSNGVLGALGAGVVVAAASVGGGAGCSSEEPTVERTLTDTTLAHFTLTCGTYECALAPAPAVGGCGGDAALGAGEFLLLCAADGATPRPPGCRVMTCESDDTCANIFAEPFVCRSGLCERKERTADGSLTREDFLALCLASVPRAQVCTDGDLAGVKAGSSDVLVTDLVARECSGARCASLPVECAR